ncbi:MAG: hypothetical protein M3Q87_13170 [Actinomycetota bacterium]|nr:hypothetical protein [Actinomycetota bacterium]
MRREGWLLAVLLVVLIASSSSPALADGGVSVEPGENSYNPGVWTGGVISEEGVVESDPNNSGGTIQATSEPTLDYEWVLACFDNHPEGQNELCGAATICAGPGELQWNLWARQLTDQAGQPTPGADWEIIATECHSFQPAEPAADPQPQVTDAVVLQAVRRLGLPRLTVQVQPADQTLVHLDTIFYAEPPDWSRSLVLLGFNVDVTAEPVGYAWRFGDGTSVSTTSPGAPYPAPDITHTYTDAHVSVTPRVDTAYEVRYRVDGGPWRTISDTVPAAGWPVNLRIREATPVLVGGE